jgi:hypothetical protein
MSDYSWPFKRRGRVGPRRAGRLRVAAFIVALTGLTGFASLPAAAAAASPAGPQQAAGHQMKARPGAAKTNAKSAAALPGPLLYHGGLVQTAPKVYIDFWGWTSDPSAEQPYLIDFLDAVGGSQWLNTVNLYGGGSAGNLLINYWDDPSQIPDQPTDAQIQQEAKNAIGAMRIPKSVNAQVVVALPTGHAPAGFGTSYCAYHGVIADTTKTYTNMTYTALPYVPDAGSACGANAVNPGSAGRLDGVSIVEGHELAETITDPNINAWIDSSGNEIGDKCAWIGMRDVPMGGIDVTFPVQALWSNASNSCITTAPQWTDWASEIGAPPPGIAPGSSPSTATWGANRLDVFVRGKDDAIWDAYWDGTRWNAWQSLGPDIVSNPAAVANGPNPIDLFGIGTDGNVWHKYYTSGTWSNWASEIGAPPPGIAPGSSPSAATWGGNRLDVFVRGNDDAIWHSWWDGVSWSAWQSLGPTIISDPTAVGAGPNIFDLFGIGTDGNVWHKYYTNP